MKRVANIKAYTYIVTQLQRNEMNLCRGQLVIDDDVDELL